MILLNHISHTYPGAIPALRDLSLSIASGECLVVLGPTGSGKSTLLRILAGLEVPTGGRVQFDGRDVTRAPPNERQAALVSQRHLLYPHLSVRENLTFGLDRPDISEAVKQMGLTALLGRRPGELSGGQAQRVALGRALARRARLWLLDEPFGHLDPATRWERIRELPLLRERGGFTMIVVTHEQEEAFALGDRVAVLDRGRLLQVDTPRAVHERPGSVTAARLLGWPPLNVLRGTLRADASGVRLDRPSGPVPLPPPLHRWGRFDGQEVLLGSRPDAGLPLPMAGARPVPGPTRGWLVGDVGGEPVVVAEGAVPFDAAKVHLFRAQSGEVLSHGAGP
ncbi:MAG: ABC transporter ATP-binding protein [Gemmataceae bacterium]